MEAPPVQYAKTTDGFDIAYTVCGEGRPLVLIPPGISHVRLHWGIPSAGSWYEALSKRFRLINYDARGQGLSTRGLPASLKMEDYELDLEAVVQRLELSRFVLMAPGPRAHMAVRFALANPARVDALVLVHSAASRDELPGVMFGDLARHNWEVLLRNASPGEGWDEAQRRDVTERFRQSATQADFIAAGEAFAKSDISSLLPQLNVPTLVLHARDNIHAKLDGSVRLAALIPDARLALIDGYNYFGDAEQGVQAISSFLENVGEHEEAAPDRPSTQSGLSDREREILALLASGESNKQIAHRLSLSLNTVNHHVSNIYAKIEAPNRASATAYALRQGIV